MWHQWNLIKTYMLKILRSFGYRYRVVKRTNGQQGKPLPNMNMFYLTGDQGQDVSLWNDIPLNLKGDTVTACIQIPKQICNKYELIKQQKGNPIMQDTKKNIFTKQLQLRYYAHFPLFNYGFLPRTWEQNLVKEKLGFFGDDDPVDILDLSSRKRQIGSIFKAKVLGCFCLIDQDEIDWKVLMVDAQEAQYQRINDMSYYSREQIEATMEWFKKIKLFDGKKENNIAYNQKIFSKDQTLKIINDTHLEWKKLVSSPDPIYDEPRSKFHLKDFKFFE